MPDPWLTKKGDVVPALKIAGMPEWAWTDGQFLETQRLATNGVAWHVEWFTAAGKWKVRYGLGTHEAAAIIEKDQLEKLIAKHAVDGATLTIDHEGAEGYCYITVAGSDGTTRTLAEEATYPEALQAAVMAAKEREP